MSNNKPKPTLMYDKLYRRSVQSDRYFRNWEQNFRNLPVYDFTSVADVISEVPTDGIPKKLPHKVVWAEWITDEKHVGVYIGECPGRVEIDGIPDGYDIHLCVGFIAAGRKANAFTDTFKGRIIALDQAYAIGVHRETYQHVIAKLTYKGATGKLADDWLGGPSLAKVDEMRVEEYDQMFIHHMIEPLIGAMAMLSCRNIVTESVPQTGTHRKLRKGVEDRPWATYKVLKLEMPNRVVQRQPSEPGVDEDDNDGPKVRFHLCRGHFKNLTHARYKNARGLHWWPAHWKGSIELGRVDKRYAGVPA